MARKPSIPLITDFNNIPEEALVPEAEQPFGIPDHWKWVRLQSLNSFHSKTIDPSKFPDELFELFSVPTFPTGKPEFVSGSEIGSTKQIVSPNDVLICKINPRINRVWRVPENSNLRQLASSEWISFRPSYGNPDFFSIYFASEPFRRMLTANVSGVGGSLTRARPKDVAGYPVPLPPKDEQEAIIPVLLQQLVSVDSTVTAIKGVLSNYEEQVKSLIQAGLSGELTADWREEHDRSRDEWTQTTLGKAFKWSSGGTPSRKHAEYYNGTIPWVKSGELPNGVITETSEHITEEAIKNSSAKVFPTGSVLIAMYGATIGQVGILSMDAATNQAIAAAQTSPHTLNEYLFYFLQASKEEFIALGKGGAQPNISQTVIKSFPYAIPPLDEQKLIIERLKTNLQCYQEAKSKIEAALKLLDHTKENLVIAGLSGKLV